jgi:hypothetical protein
VTPLGKVSPNINTLYPPLGKVENIFWLRNASPFGLFLKGGKIYIKQKTISQVMKDIFTYLIVFLTSLKPLGKVSPNINTFVHILAPQRQSLRTFLKGGF